MGLQRIRFPNEGNLRMLLRSPAKDMGFHQPFYMTITWTIMDPVCPPLITHPAHTELPLLNPEDSSLSKCSTERDQEIQGNVIVNKCCIYFHKHSCMYLYN